MIYSSNWINAAALGVAAIAIAAIAYFLFRSPRPQPVQVERPAMCKELDMALDLREGAKGQGLQLSMQSARDRDDRCERVMRGVAR
jgi:hypothetical protein